MRARRFLTVIALGAALLPVADRAGAATITLEQVAGGLSRPTYVTHAGDGTGRLFVTEQPGRVRVIDGSGLLPTPFLDISSLVNSGGEQGLLSVSFHPGYEANGYFFVYHTDSSGSNNIVARYHASPPSSNVANPASRQVVLSIPHPTHANHNGGQLQFGPDGYLYIGTGDGGGSGDPNDNAENLSSLLGKMLRIDVDSAFPYAIPPGNPFADGGGPNRDEIWAYGLRNPWRFSFDRATGDLFIGDVGQNLREEIDFAPAGQGGQHWGWDTMEGSLCFEPSTGCDTSGKTLPILEYPLAGEECAVSGGYRYRGGGSLEGIYFYGDYCSGRIWGATTEGSVWQTTELLDTNLLISSFGEDETGNLYLAHHSSTAGAIYRITGVGWQNWESLGGVLASGPDVSSWGPGRLDVFVQGTDNQLWHRWWDANSWSDWEPLGGVLTSGPGAVSWSDGRIDVFVRGDDNQLWHRWYDGAWSPWEPLGGVLTSGPDVSSWGPGRLDVFVQGTDNQLWHRWWDANSWSDWEPLGGVLTSGPGAVSWSDGRIDVFVRGDDNQLWHRWYDGAWSPWEPLGGVLTSGPDVSSWGPGRLDVFVQGTDNQLWHRWWDANSWSDWEPLGGVLTSGPGAVSWGAERIDVFVQGLNNALWHRWFGP
jgi:hypothetical protein